MTSLTFGGEAEAASVYGLAADLTGDRSVGDGLTLDGDSDWSDVTVAWDIQWTGTHFLYTYTLTGLGSPGLSHLVLDITDDALDGDDLADPDAVVNPTINGDSWDNDMEYKEDEFTQNQPFMTGVIKFDDIEGEDTDTFVITLESNRAPVWGDIFLKGGQTDLYNTAYGSLSESILSDKNNFVARPNGETVIVPLPAAAWGGLVLLGMLGAGQTLRKRRLAQQVV
ncbi:MAG: hypothetical protein WDZ31_02665 [Phycisphaeraceae bacterium]